MYICIALDPLLKGNVTPIKGNVTPVYNTCMPNTKLYSPLPLERQRLGRRLTHVEKTQTALYLHIRFQPPWSWHRKNRNKAQQAHTLCEGNWAESFTTGKEEPHYI